MTITPELKRKISARWNIISRGQRHNPFESGREMTAFAQLEYILIEAGLLAQRRAPRRERAMLDDEDNAPGLNEIVAMDNCE